MRPLSPMTGANLNGDLMLHGIVLAVLLRRSSPLDLTFSWEKLQLGVSSSDAHSGGVSPLWAVMTGTIRLGKGVRREAESEESR